MKILMKSHSLDKFYSLVVFFPVNRKCLDNGLHFALQKKRPDFCSWPLFAHNQPFSILIKICYYLVMHRWLAVRQKVPCICEKGGQSTLLICSLFDSILLKSGHALVRPQPERVLFPTEEGARLGSFVLNWYRSFD